MVTLLLALSLLANPLASTPLDVAEEMLAVAEVTKKDVVWDLGCGDGRIVILASKRYGCRSVGVEIEPKIAGLARRNVLRNGVRQLVTIRTADATKVDFQSATVVTLYVTHELLRKLTPKLTKLPPGTRIVSHYHQIPGWKPDRVVIKTSVSGNFKHVIFLWRIKGKGKAK